MKAIFSEYNTNVGTNISTSYVPIDVPYGGSPIFATGIATQSNPGYCAFNDTTYTKGPSINITNTSTSVRLPLSPIKTGRWGVNFTSTKTFEGYIATSVTSYDQDNFDLPGSPIPYSGIAYEYSYDTYVGDYVSSKSWSNIQDLRSQNIPHFEYTSMTATRLYPVINKHISFYYGETSSNVPIPYRSEVVTVPERAITVTKYSTRNLTYISSATFDHNRILMPFKYATGGDNSPNVQTFGVNGTGYRSGALGTTSQATTLYAQTVPKANPGIHVAVLIEHTSSYTRTYPMPNRYILSQEYLIEERFDNNVFTSESNAIVKEYPLYRTLSASLYKSSATGALNSMNVVSAYSASTSSGKNQFVYGTYRTGNTEFNLYSYKFSTHNQIARNAYNYQVSNDSIYNKVGLESSPYDAEVDPVITSDFSTWYSSKTVTNYASQSGTLSRVSANPTTNWNSIEATAYSGYIASGAKGVNLSALSSNMAVGNRTYYFRPLGTVGAVSFGWAVGYKVPDYALAHGCTMVYRPVAPSSSASAYIPSLLSYYSSQAGYKTTGNAFDTNVTRTLAANTATQYLYSSSDSYTFTHLRESFETTFWSYTTISAMGLSAQLNNGISQLN